MKRVYNLNKNYYNINIPYYSSLKNNKTKLDNIDSLVFGIGGLKGICYCGVLLALKNYGILKNIKNICGVSAGSIVSFLYIIGYSPEEIIKINLNLDYSKIMNPDYKKLMYGCLDDGIKFERIFNKFLSAKNIKENITMKELYELTNINFTIVVFNSTTNKLEYMNYLTEPNIKVATAVRMSSSIPLYFKPVEYKGCMYRDGGIGITFPINYYKDKSKVLGFRFSNTNDIIDNADKLNIEAGVLNIYNSISIRDDIMFCETETNYLTINTTMPIIDGSINKKNKLKGIIEGYLDTLKFLKKYN